MCVQKADTNLDRSVFFWRTQMVRLSCIFSFSFHFGNPTKRKKYDCHGSYIQCFWSKSEWNAENAAELGTGQKGGVLIIWVTSQDQSFFCCTGIHYWSARMCAQPSMCAHLFVSCQPESTLPIARAVLCVVHILHLSLAMDPQWLT